MAAAPSREASRTDDKEHTRQSGPTAANPAAVRARDGHRNDTAEEGYAQTARSSMFGRDLSPALGTAAIWGIENKAFNGLTQSYHLEHCDHHEPASLLAQRLILLPGCTLFTALAELPNKLVRLGELTAKAPTKERDLALEEDLPWEQWFHSGQENSGGRAPAPGFFDRR